MTPTLDLQVCLPDLAATPFVPARGSRPDSPCVHRDARCRGDHDDYTRAKSAFFAEIEPALTRWAAGP
ncbi:hypothetical protein [Lentzea sp. CA-135723]|uniref:hypothetical protein n=1 Tax=Lentzea sp. CA-135723 TaxID=3239950 RepID=UPI003D922ED9